MSYSIVFTVPAASRFEAIANAVAMLRSNVQLRGVISATPTAGAYWDVVLSVHEDV